MSDDNTQKLPEKIVDGLYDIALDPEGLDRFIDAWNGAGLDAEEVRRTVEKVDAFDAAFRDHLTRADEFLARHNTDNARTFLLDALDPFDANAAIVLDSSLAIVAQNAGAGAAYGLQEGADLSDLPLYDVERAEMNDVLHAISKGEAAQSRLLNFESPVTGRPVIFHIRKLSSPNAAAKPFILIVTTEFYWSPVLNQTLEEVFSLSSAERGIVQSLVEGRDPKAIAAARGTSVETVRTQLRSILSKTKARSQSELIRLVLSLREVVGQKADTRSNVKNVRMRVAADWLEEEVWKPYETLIMPDGRRMDYHVQGPVDGAPILFTHMGYGQIRWPKPILKLAYRHGLRVICPIRAGYGKSDNLPRKADVCAETRADTRALLDHLKIARLPYVAQGNDLMFAVDFAADTPERVSEIIGLGGRPFLPGDAHYAGMQKWHRYFLSTAQHAPHLLFFSIRAAMTLARKIGLKEMFVKMNKSSPSDMRLLESEDFGPVMLESAKLLVDDTTIAAQGYATELLVSEADWSHLMHATKKIPTWFFNGSEDPSFDMATIAAYREAYPWVDIEVVDNAGQMVFYQQYEVLVPRLAEAAKRAQG